MRKLGVAVARDPLPPAVGSGSDGAGAGVVKVAPVGGRIATRRSQKGRALTLCGRRSQFPPACVPANGIGRSGSEVFPTTISSVLSKVENRSFSHELLITLL
jgi:hypothetical protein